jgi:hypothetical protein
MTAADKIALMLGRALLSAAQLEEELLAANARIEELEATKTPRKSS